MKIFVGVTDHAWFDLLRNQPWLEEVNFWQPSGRTQFRALQPGEMFLFKLHSPDNFIVGGGFFAHSSLLPISMAWESFGISNGAVNLSDMRKKVEKYREQSENRFADYTIGCILLEQPFFLPRELWIPIPEDWKANIVRGRDYDLTGEPGLTLWQRIQAALAVSAGVREQPARYGNPALVLPRLGHGSFRVLVTDVYERRCAITNERTLPALEAAHIKPFSENGPLSVNNGILMRRDLHALYDRGYLTITPAYQIEVSRRIKEEFENGKEYYRHHGNQIRIPTLAGNRPSAEFLVWHNENIYRG